MANRYLELLDVVPDFERHLVNNEAAYTDKMTTLQINVGSLCNQACKHCHVEGGPNRTDSVMSKEVMEACLEVYQQGPNFETIDITGGAPEMNPNFEWLLREACKFCDHVIVRCNLTILEEPEYAHYAELYKELGVEVFSSLPYYSKKDTDRQRGTDVFDKSIRALQKLNSLGYGIDPELSLNLVYNPGGAFLPPPQTGIEVEFKKKLRENYGIEFNHIFAITNNPIGRFAQFLDRTGNMERYMNTLFNAYNPGSEMAMMCRFQLSVMYDGSLYDCDFNQVVELPIEGMKTIFDWLEEPAEKRHIMLANHCYGCTAGQGSSCGGATA